MWLGRGYSTGKAGARIFYPHLVSICVSSRVEKDAKHMLYARTLNTSSAGLSDL